MGNLNSIDRNIFELIAYHLDGPSIRNLNSINKKFHRFCDEEFYERILKSHYEVEVQSDFKKEFLKLSSTTIWMIDTSGDNQMIYPLDILPRWFDHIDINCLATNLNYLIESKRYFTSLNFEKTTIVDNVTWHLQDDPYEKVIYTHRCSYYLTKNGSVLKRLNLISNEVAVIYEKDAADIVSVNDDSQLMILTKFGSLAMYDRIKDDIIFVIPNDVAKICCSKEAFLLDTNGVVFKLQQPGDIEKEKLPFDKPITKMTSSSTFAMFVDSDENIWLFGNCSAVDEPFLKTTHFDDPRIYKLPRMKNPVTQLLSNNKYCFIVA